MQYGVCCEQESAEAWAEFGFDFFECTVGSFLKPLEERPAFEDALARTRATPLVCPVVNCFVPGDLRITGPDADLAALERYVTTTFERAKEADVQIIVFGSGGARRVPDGFDHDTARKQIVSFCTMLAPMAEMNGVTIAVEPLNRQDCNILTSVRETAELVHAVGHPAVRLLVDAHHFLRDDKALDDIRANAALLVHVHIATVPGRLPPGAEPCDLAPFFIALVEGGYDGRICIEGNIPAPDLDLPRALTHMRTLEAQVKS